MSLYTEQINAIKEVTENSPELTIKKVYKGDYEVIPLFPAIAINLKGRSKVVKGIGGLKETQCRYEVWIYSNKPSYEASLAELEGLVEGFEKTIEKNRTLGGTVNDCNVDSEAEFGVADRGGVFLQTALLQINTRKLGV